MIDTIELGRFWTEYKLIHLYNIYLGYLFTYLLIYLFSSYFFIFRFQRRMVSSVVHGFQRRTLAMEVSAFEVRHFDRKPG